MKRVIAALILIVVIFAVSLFGNRYVNVTLDEIAAVAEDESVNIEKLWEKKRSVLSVFLVNDDIDSIEELIYSGGDIHQLEYVIKSIKEGERLIPENIL